MKLAGAVLMLAALAGCPKTRETENESANQRDLDCPFPQQDQVPANGVMVTTAGDSGGTYVVFDADAHSVRFRECASHGAPEQTRVLAPERAAALYALALEADAANNWTAPEYPDWGLSLTITKGTKRRQIQKNGQFTEGPAKQLLADLKAAAGVRW